MRDDLAEAPQAALNGLHRVAYAIAQFFLDLVIRFATLGAQQCDLQRIGRIEEVLIEGPSKRDASMISGRTRQNKLVHFAGSEPLRLGSTNWGFAHLASQN